MMPLFIQTLDADIVYLNIDRIVSLRFLENTEPPRWRATTDNNQTFGIMDHVVDLLLANAAHELPLVRDEPEIKLATEPAAQKKQAVA